MEFRNSTALDDEQLRQMVLRHTLPYKHDKLRVAIRYSRGADFSGTCFYREARIYVNVGRHVRYPYEMGTHIARARSNRTHWWRETYRITLRDPYQLALFVYLHELYHYLVKLAGRSPRQKESRCDRFATQVLVDEYGCPVTDRFRRRVPRELWDFQDLHKFVAKAPKVAPVQKKVLVPQFRPIPVHVHGLDEPLTDAG